MNLTGAQQPNPFPPPDAQQLPLFSVNPVHGVLGVRAAAVSASASAAAPQGPVVDLGQGALDKNKLASNFPQMLLFCLPWLVTVLPGWKGTGFLLFSRSFKMFLFQARLSLRMSMLWLSPVPSLACLGLLLTVTTMVVCML